MKFSELIPITAALVNLLLTVFVLTRDQRSALNRVYLLWGLSITVWNVGVFFLFRVKSPAEALFWARFLQFGVIFLPISLFHLCLLVARMPVPRLLPVLYGVQGLLALSNFTGFFIANIKKLPYAYYSVAGPGFWIFAVTYTALTSTTVVMLYRKQRTLPKLHRMRLKSLLLASVILIVFGNNDILPILGFYTYPFTDIPIYPVGSLAAIFYGLIVGYSVLQHRLLDIQVTLSRVAAHIVRFLFLCLIGLSLLLLVSIAAPANQFPAFAFFSSLAVLMVSASVAAIFFPRLFGKGDDALERRILGDRFEYHDQIQGFIQSIQLYTDTKLLLDDLHALLVHTIKVSSYQIILLDETTRSFKIFRMFPDNPAAPLPELRSNSPIFEYFRTSGADYLAFNLANAIPGETELERTARGDLQVLAPEFCFPLSESEDPFGLLLLGVKTSDEPYTMHDAHLLAQLVKNLSLIINQIRLKNQVLLAEELELLGRMSRGMAHDLNNLLTPVSTLLQLCAEGDAYRGAVEELLPVASRNVGTMQAYIKEALFFSQHHTPQIQLARIDLLLHKVAELADPKSKRKGVEIAVHAPTHVTADMDEVLVQRLVSNLVSNAIDASPAGTQIVLDLQVLAKTENRRDWLRLRVVDSGEGISAENLKRISTAYFTTKDKGDETRGFGLGLSICRKIVHLHGGNLTISSEERKGTVVQVDLPSRHIAPTPRPIAART